jgi:hypothetical protein
MDIKIEGEQPREQRHYWKIGEMFRFQTGLGVYMITAVMSGCIQEYVSLTNTSAGIKYPAGETADSRYVMVQPISTLRVREVH